MVDSRERKTNRVASAECGLNNLSPNSPEFFALHEEQAQLEQFPGL